MKTAEERFNEFVNKFAASRGVEPKDILNLAVVKEYKDWVVKECKDYDYSREEEILKTVQEIDSEDKCSGKGTPQY